MTPTIGCIIKPESGPAIHTSDVFDLVSPSWSRYGVQSDIQSVSICPLRQEAKGQRTSHLNSPGEPVVPESIF